MAPLTTSTKAAGSPHTTPPAKVRSATSRLLVNTKAEKPARPAAESPRSVPSGWGSATQRNASGTRPRAAAGSRSAHSSAGNAGSSSSTAETASSAGRSASRRQ